MAVGISKNSARFGQDGCRYDRLPITQPAIAWADLAVLKNLKAIRFEACAKQASEAAVVHAAAGERYLLNARDGAG